MDSIDNVKAEKLKALQRFNHFRRIASFFRVAEIFVPLLFISWTLTRLPFALQIFVEFLRRIAAVISTPLFVFLLGNSIVVVLLTKSSDQRISSTENEIYQAFVRSVENHRSKPSDEKLTEEIKIIYDDKEMIVTDLNSNSNSNLITEIDRDLSSDSVSDQLKIYRRSKSEVSANQVIVTDFNSISNSNPISEENIPHSDELKLYERSKSDVSSKQSTLMKRSLQRSEKNKNYPEDNLSNEEFQKTIEAFIAKQLMFRRQESLAVVRCSS